MEHPLTRTLSRARPETDDTPMKDPCKCCGTAATESEVVNTYFNGDPHMVVHMCPVCDDVVIVTHTAHEDIVAFMFIHVDAARVEELNALTFEKIVEQPDVSVRQAVWHDSLLAPSHLYDEPSVEPEWDYPTGKDHFYQTLNARRKRQRSVVVN
jgi:hypothetical protein